MSPDFKYAFDDPYSLNQLIFDVVDKHQKSKMDEESQNIVVNQCLKVYVSDEESFQYFTDAIKTICKSSPIYKSTLNNIKKSLDSKHFNLFAAEIKSINAKVE